MESMVVDYVDYVSRLDLSCLDCCCLHTKKDAVVCIIVV